MRITLFIAVSFVSAPYLFGSVHFTYIRFIVYRTVTLVSGSHFS